MTACWGSTFFLIQDLLDRVPVAGLPGGPVRDRLASRCCWSPRARSRRLSAADAPPRGRARPRSTASRRSCRPPAWRTRRRASRGFITGLYVVCTPLLAAAAAPHPDRAGHLGRRRARDRRARRADPERASASATARRSPWSPRCSTRCTSSALGALVDRPGRARDVDPPDHRDRGGLPRRRPRPTGSSLPDRAADWSRSSTWRWSPARWRCSARPGRRPTSPPTRSAIIMSMEPVFAAFFAVLLGGEDAHRADARRRRDGAGRDAHRRARPAPRGRGRGPAHRRVGPPSHGWNPTWVRPPIVGPVDTCVACGAELGVGRFCLNCGHRIGAPAPVRPEQPPAPSPPVVSPTVTATARGPRASGSGRRCAAGGVRPCGGLRC